MKKLSKIFSMSSKAGFTMIELLVVIAVIGVLAVAVLSSINPIEQINKGRDTRTRSDAAQLINAIDRYYAIHEKYVWNVTNTGPVGDGYTATDLIPSAEFDFIGAGSPLLDAGLAGAGESDWDWIDSLVSTAEVKEGFVNRVTDDNLHFIAKAQGYNETMYVCFQPTSNAFKQEAMENCADGTTPITINTITVCADDTDIDALNLICLP